MPDSMRKEIPQPVVIAAIALMVIAAGWLLWRAIQGPAELPRGPINVGTEDVPEYIEGMTPEMQKMIEEQTKKYGTPNAGASSETSQPAANR